MQDVLQQPQLHKAEDQLAVGREQAQVAGEEEVGADAEESQVRTIIIIINFWKVY